MLTTPLHAWHVAHGGRMVDFAGWSMPVQYSTITEEHVAVRTKAGLFDISHMGHLRIGGPDAVDLAERLVTCRVATLKPGQVRYGLVTNETGGILDDVLVYGIDARAVAFVVNAANRDKIASWFREQADGADASVKEPPTQGAMIALQGPASAGILAPHADFPIAEMGYYRHHAYGNVFGMPVAVSRTGYTGEDGFELMVAGELAVPLWEAVLAAGKDAGIVPCGLGCRDTLRLEAGMPLYGHELSEEIDPITAGLSFAVALGKEFIGRDAIAKVAEREPERVRVGLKLAGKRIAREGTPLFQGDDRVGEVTSGTFSPTLQASIAMGYVTPELAKPGTTVEADLRGKREPATVVELPFYRRS
ncbi:MAG: glycine cleavage system aminomethyltransferase GcvT [Planctomycetaceae bacterium]